MVDTPIVRESLQKAYRQEFPSQVSSGRDLHVSDVIVPVVDFTQASSGSTIPFELQTAVNANTTSGSYFAGVSGNVTIASAIGFYLITLRYNSLSATGGGGFDLKSITSSATTTVGTYILGTNIFESKIYYFVPQNGSLRLDADSLTNVFFSVTPVADGNGNLINPSGFSPQ